MDIINFFSNFLESLASKNNIISKEEFWYLSPKQHVIELFLFNIIFIFGLFGNY